MSRKIKELTGSVYRESFRGIGGERDLRARATVVVRENNCRKDDDTRTHNYYTLVRLIRDRPTTIVLIEVNRLYTAISACIHLYYVQVLLQ